MDRLMHARHSAAVLHLLRNRHWLKLWRSELGWPPIGSYIWMYGSWLFIKGLPLCCRRYDTEGRLWDFKSPCQAQALFLSASCLQISYSCHIKPADWPYCYHISTIMTWTYFWNSSQLNASFYKIPWSVSFPSNRIITEKTQDRGKRT